MLARAWRWLAREAPASKIGYESESPYDQLPVLGKNLSSLKPLLPETLTEGLLELLAIFSEASALSSCAATEAVSGRSRNAAAKRSLLSSSRSVNSRASAGWMSPAGSRPIASSKVARAI